MKNFRTKYGFTLLVSIGKHFSADYLITVGPNLTISTSDPCNFNSDQMLNHLSIKSNKCASVFLWGIIFLCRETLKTSRDWSTILLILVDSSGKVSANTAVLTGTLSYSNIRHSLFLCCHVSHGKGQALSFRNIMFLMGKKS